jgi:hypothetical protein
MNWRFEMNVDKNGIMRKLCIKQGYVPPCCTMDGFYILAFINSGKSPCKGCCNEEECELSHPIDEIEVPNGD